MILTATIILVQQTYTSLGSLSVFASKSHFQNCQRKANSYSHHTLKKVSKMPVTSPPKCFQKFFNGKGAVFENFPYHSLTLISSSPRRQTHHLRTHRTGCASRGRGDLAQGHPGGRRGAPGSAATVDRCKNLYHYFHCEIWPGRSCWVRWSRGKKLGL